MSLPIILDATGVPPSSARFAALASALRPHAILIRTRRGLEAVPPDVASDAPVQDGDAAFMAIRAWLLASGPLGADVASTRSSPRPGWTARGRSRLAALATRPLASVDLPPAGLLLKIGLSGWDDPALASWLAGHPGIWPVCLATRIWQLDFPEYEAAEIIATLPASVQAMTRLARRLVVPTDVARDRLSSALGAASPPLTVLPTPSRLAGSATASVDPALAGTPYLLAVDRLEARGNILMLLGIWRDLVRSGAAVPKLVLAGRRGAQIQELKPMLDWNETNRPFVREAPGVTADGLRTLTLGARAILSPSFAPGSAAFERDALGMGVPVLAADGPTCRASLGTRAVLLDPIDGPAWRDAILKAAMTVSRPPPDRVEPTSWADYASQLRAMLGSSAIDPIRNRSLDL
ncbi:hypothetical protein LGH83_13680 [Lichenihabitans sp. PAMC28606]|uniref:hypothetical protein n=1 Tax=Lichenihabitans sp. PAMC28606 TaxID=2880932 RepID=UPI001D0BB71E|nr:hypothetical protein [Lichenihabitans sp. PAMC28606]UDL93614.1 hypothetical protein LGH83_13680 [Lichenihabitans sp. PAMC28606]